MMAITLKRLIVGGLLAAGLYASQTLAYVKCDGKWVSIGAFDYCIPNNVAPSVGNQALTMNENTTGYLGINVTDPDAGDSHTLSIVSGSPYGSAWFSGTTLVFTPHAYWYGTTQVAFQAVDSKNAVSNVATVTITVNHVNIAPTVSNRTLNMDENTTGTIVLDVADPNPGDWHSMWIVSPSPHGAATLSGRTLSFKPNQYWYGDTQLTYQAVDSKGAVSNIGTVTIKVKHVNIPPTVTNAALTIDEDTSGSVVVAVTDPNPGDSYQLTVVSAPNGTASFTGDRLTFKPNPNWNGTSKVTYRAIDSKSAQSNIGTFEVTVRPVNDRPVGIQYEQF